jgi:CheY-like chemotaxis protein
MLDLARVESGKLEFNPEPVAPEKLVDEVIQLLETLALSKDIQIEKSVSAELGVVIVDGGRVKQILYNYLSNAVKFTPEGGRVIVRAVPEPPDRFRLEVEDSGIGIRPEDIDGLFTECRQLDDGRGKRYQGTGLGLARTRRIVEAQGGEVGVRSTPGEGSVFHAVLPCMFQQKSVSPEGETPRLLVVESDPLDADLLADLLARAGLGVEIAATEAETLALCRLRRFAAILLSPSRPAAQNAELFQKIRARSGASGVNRNTPIIVVCSEAEKKLGLSFAVGEVLGKPVVCEELLAALGRAGVRPPGARNGASAEARAGKELDA